MCIRDRYTAGFDVTSGDIIQGYMSDVSDRETVIQELNKEYLNYIE